MAVGATVGDEQRQTVEEKVGRTRRRRPRGSCERRLGHLDRVGAAGQTTDDHGGGERLEIGFASQPDVERLELPAGFEQQRGSVATSSCRKRDLRPKEVHTRAAELVKRPGLGHRNQRERGFGGAGVVLGLGRGQRPLGPARGVEGQPHGLLQERGRSGHASPGLCTIGGTFQFGGNALVRSDGGVRAVPGAAVWIKVWIGHLGERAVHVLTIQQRRRSVGRRAHERMAKPDPSAELDQPRCLGGGGGLVPDAEPTHGAPQQRVIAARLGRGREEHPPRLDRSGSSRRRNPSSMRPASGIVSVSPNPNANSAGESPRGNSSNASGLPRVSATIRSRTR